MIYDKREAINAFKANFDLIRKGPDGYPLPDQGLELDVLGRQLLKVGMVCSLGSDPEERSLQRFTDATARMLAAMISGDRDPAIPAAVFKARAEVVEPKD